MPVGLPESETLQVGRPQSERVCKVTCASRQAKRALRYGSDAREVPVFILRGGIPKRLEAGDPFAAQVLEPIGTWCLAREVLAVDLDRAGCPRNRAFTRRFHRLSQDGIVARELPRRDLSHAAPAATFAEPCIQS